MLPAPSFRDPAGICLRFSDSIFRFVQPQPAQELEAFLASAPARSLLEKGKIVSSRRLEEKAAASLRERLIQSGFSAPPGERVVFEHDRVSFPSYPHEWSAEMLWSAGQLTLEVAQTAAEAGVGLKDASPANVLFRGTRPVFVDVLSFERRDPRDPVWKPYGQFVRTFLLPLLAHREWNLSPAEIFITRRDGLEPDTVYRMAGPLRRLRPRFLGLVSIPTWLGRRAGARNGSIYDERRSADPEQAQFILRSLLRGLQRQLQALEPRRRPASAWSGYMNSLNYRESDFAAKEGFVSDAFREFKPRRVLDVGSNTGHFSLLAARVGAEVVAIDSDPACAGMLWRRAEGEGANVLPLVVDLGRPSPALGWRNAECPSFLDRATGAFDGLLLLAVLHHLLVSERIPLEQAMGLAAELTTDMAVVEFVGPQDEMFRRMARGRDALHADLDPGAFERACMPHFEIVRRLRLGESHRWLYLLRRRRGAP